jgi:hypothetical protein
MNNKGQVWGYAIMLSIVVIVLGLALAPAGKSFIDSAMGNSTADFIGLNCDTTTDNFVKGACTITDFSLAYVIGGIVLIGCGIIGARFTFGE